MQSPHIRTALPGPKTPAQLVRDALVISPAYPRDDVDEALRILTAAPDEARMAAPG